MDFTTKENKTVRHWFLTWNDKSAPKDPRDAKVYMEALRRQLVDQVMNNGATYVVCGIEKGKKGTSHLQGVVSFKSAKSFSRMKGMIPNVHWEAVINLQAAYSYCKKEGDYIEEGTATQDKRQNGHHGVNQGHHGVNQGHHGDNATSRAAGAKVWTDAMKLIKQGRTDEINPRLLITRWQAIKSMESYYLRSRCPEDIPELTNYWIWGKTGNGKSKGVRELIGNRPFFLKNFSKWWDAYKGEEIVLLDDIPLTWFAAGGAQQLKTWLDHYRFTMESKGHSGFGRPRVIFITANFSLEKACMGMDADEILGPLSRRLTQVYFPTPEEESTLFALPPSVGKQCFWKEMETMEQILGRTESAARTESLPSSGEEEEEEEGEEDEVQVVNPPVTPRPSPRRKVMPARPFKAPRPADVVDLTEDEPPFNPSQKHLPVDLEEEEMEAELQRIEEDYRKVQKNIAAARKSMGPDFAKMWPMGEPARPPTPVPAPRLRMLAQAAADKRARLQELEEDEESTSSTSEPMDGETLGSQDSDTDGEDELE